MLKILDVIAHMLEAAIWPLFAASLVAAVVLGCFALYDEFVDACRDKPERGEALSAFIKAWLTK